jgi:hypothetical protein
MTTDWMEDLAVLLRWLEQFVDSASRDPRPFRYARDLLGLMRWLRAQPPRRAALSGVLGTGVVIAMVVASRYGQQRDQSPSPNEPHFADAADAFGEAEWTDET